MVPFNHNIHNLARAVKERVFFVKRNGMFCSPLAPGAGWFSECLTDTRKRLHKLLPRLTPWTRQEFLDSCKGSKRRVYEAAATSLDQTGGLRLAVDSAVNVFVKFEKTDHTSKLDPVPRVISPRSPRFNLCVGKYLKKLEPRLFKSLDGLFGHPTVIKGKNAYESASLLKQKWEMFKCPVAVGLDASRFDQHVSEQALRWEHDVYLSCFPLRKDSKKLRAMLECQIVNKCKGFAPDGKLQYRVTGTRMSGDMNTSLGNCLLMVSMVRQYLNCRGIDGQLANNGDDCVVFMEKHDLCRFSEGLYDWFAAMGFDMKIEDPVFEFGKIEFCQTKPVYDGSRWVMCRNPLTALAKDSVMLIPYSGARHLKGWMDSVGTGGLALTGQLPVFQDFYAWLVRNGDRREVKERHLSWSMIKLSQGMDRAYGPVSPVTRASFYDSFDITPDEQVLLEAYYRELKYSDLPGPYCARPIFQ